MNTPRKGTLDYTVREVAQKDGISEASARAILRESLANGHDIVRKHRAQQAKLQERERTTR